MLDRPCHRQLTLFDEPDEPLDSEEGVQKDGIDPTRADIKDGLDELFAIAGKYRSGNEYMKLLNFVKGFRFYSPFNAMLIHTQRPGAKYVATPKRWSERYGYNVKVSATPITILRPMGPVMFVFDVTDVEPGPWARPLPPEVVNPFDIRRGTIGNELDLTIANAKRDGISISDHQAGSQLAGSIRRAPNPGTLNAVKSKRPDLTYETVPKRYEMLLSTHLSKEARYATLVHELGHLYCGHLGTPDPKWWPNRSGRSRVAEEFEAESVSYLVCGRLGIETTSDEYLSGYLQAAKGEVPEISVDTILRAVTLIEKMGKDYLPLRPKKKAQ